MSRTNKGSKGCGYDYWSRRCRGNYCAGYGKTSKEITKSKERMIDKKIEHDALYLIDKDDILPSFSGE